QFRPFVVSQPMPQRLEFATIFFTKVDLTPDHRWNQYRKHRPGFSSLVRKVRLDQRPEASDHHFVAGAYHYSGVVRVRFEKGRQGRSKEIAAQQCVIHPFRSVGQFLARRGLRHFEWNASVGPDLPDNAANYFSGPDVWRMVFAAMDDGDSRVSTHETVEDVFANRWNPRESQSFVDNRRNNRYGLSSADQRITKPVAVHFHKVGAIYNKCTDGSMLNVLQMETRIKLRCC